MEQHAVADAASFGNDLKATGHTAGYSGHFDSGKSVLKPESTPALTELAKGHRHGLQPGADRLAADRREVVASPVRG